MVPARRRGGMTSTSLTANENVSASGTTLLPGPARAGTARMGAVGGGSDSAVDSPATPRGAPFHLFKFVFRCASCAVLPVHLKPQPILHLCTVIHH